MTTDLFQSCDHCWAFQICWHIECSTFTALSFRIWNSSTGIPSPPLAVLVVTLLRPTWLHIPECVALGEWSYHCNYLGCEDLFCTVLLCILSFHLFLISSASVRSIPFLSFIVPIFVWNVPLVSVILLKTSLVFFFHFVVFLYFFALIAEEVFLISSCYSLELCIQMFISFLFFFAFRFSSFQNYL